MTEEHYGFTGTRDGMTQAQLESLYAILRWRPGWFHHGDCFKGDAEAHEVARVAGWKIALHPPDKDVLRAFCEADVTHEPLPYLERNRAIVEAVSILLAAPRTAEEELRSGTWSTVRYARKRGRMTTVILPDGSLDFWVGGGA